MAVPQVSFKLRVNEDETDKAIYDYLNGKPKTYIVKQAILQYMALEQNRDVLARQLVQAGESNKKKDELDEFEL